VNLRWLRDAPCDAAWNMAVDEALLLEGGEPVLRCYGFAPHAVSLGYFQRFADFADLPPGTPIVRRLTGGGAIHHGDELTFALALDASLLPRDVAASYALLHDAVLAALAAFGCRATRLPAGHGQAARPVERWCFAEPGRDDLVTPRGKLLGSAQRRIQRPRPRVLHHGSLVLRRPALTPFVAAAEDQAAGLDRDGLAEALARELAAALRLELVSSGLTAAEQALAARLRDQRYGDPAFTAQR
jgi:lipoate-protein ligase A